jgi:hypothetical protein
MSRFVPFLEWDKTRQTEHVVNQHISTDKVLSVGKQKNIKISLRPHIQHIMEFISCPVFCKTGQEIGALNGTFKVARFGKRSLRCIGDLHRSTGNNNFAENIFISILNIMSALNLTTLRLQNQHLANPVFTNPADVVKYLGAVQSQDYTGAKWALGMRLKDSTDEVIEQAFANGDIIRTHVMRPTWHFVHPEDVRWLLDLTASRVQALAKGRHKQLEIDEAVLTKSEKIIGKALYGCKQIARDELSALLKNNGINTDEQRFVHIMMHLELEQIICSGGRDGRQFTYALFDDRVPKSEKLDHDGAVVKLMERYFTSHGPATLADFVWWSGLSITDARAGIETIKGKFESCEFEGNTYWFAENDTSVSLSAAYLLPNYDEYIVSYKDRSAAIEAKNIKKADPRGTIFNHTIILNGKIEGLWKRVIKKDLLQIEVTPFNKLSRVNIKAIETAASNYAGFLGLKGAVVKQN